MDGTSCFVVRTGFRRLGIGSVLANAAAEFARRRGARAVAAYPMTTTAALLNELHVGTHAMFVKAGFTEVGRPSIRRAVMRIDFQRPGGCPGYAGLPTTT